VTFDGVVESQVEAALQELIGLLPAGAVARR